MRLGTSFGLLAVALSGAVLAAAPAAAMGPSCSLRAKQCEIICSSQPPVRPYDSPYNRCLASCQPRWHQCLRTGIWVHLEDAYPGWHEPVEIF